MYSYGPPHMAVQKQDEQLEHTFSSYVRIRDIAQKTCRRWWTIGRSGERGSGISVLAARHEDDDNDDNIYIERETVCFLTCRGYFRKIGDSSCGPVIRTRCTRCPSHRRTRLACLWLLTLTVSHSSTSAPSETSIGCSGAWFPGRTQKPISHDQFWLYKTSRGCPRGVMVKELDCRIVLQSRYYFQTNTLGKGNEPPYPPSYGLNSITTTVLLNGWIWHLAKKVDMPIKPKQSKSASVWRYSMMSWPTCMRHTFWSSFTCLGTIFVQTFCIPKSSVIIFETFSFFMSS